MLTCYRFNNFRSEEILVYYYSLLLICYNIGKGLISSNTAFLFEVLIYVKTSVCFQMDILVILRGILDTEYFKDWWTDAQYGDTGHYMVVVHCNN